ncbi:hypothetical protein [Marinifilum flexuosum]|uniref:hypothetical protein n=1 Tax=Marinifilum flexuosum TaxID=1117708 RepID=UPI0024907104|nr:hypothetical protein [Marinifilum flexuosum]
MNFLKKEIILLTVRRCKNSLKYELLNKNEDFSSDNFQSLLDYIYNNHNAQETEDKNLCAEFVEKIKESELYSFLLHNMLRLLASVGTSLSSKKYILNLSKHYPISDSLIISRKNFFLLFRHLGKIQNKSLKEYKEINRFQFEDFYLKNLVPYISISSAFFIVCGFLFTHFFLMFFGIESFRYFTFGDYLTASLGNFTNAIISIFLALLPYVLGVYARVRRSLINDVNSANSNSNSKDWVYKYGKYIFPLLMIGLAITTVLKGNSDPFPYIFNAVYITIIVNLPDVIERYFKNPIKWVVVITLSLIFIVKLCCITGSQVYNINNKGFGISGNILLRDNSLISLTKTTGILTANSSYIFLYSTIEDECWILNKTYIKKISMSNRNEMSKKIKNKIEAINNKLGITPFLQEDTNVGPEVNSEKQNFKSKLKPYE